MPNEVMLVKRKVISIPMLVIGLVLCVVPLFIYLIVYAAQKDQIVVIRLAGDTPQGATAAVGTTPVDQLRWSEDRTGWWNGSQWVDVAQELPPAASLSDDKRQWWDGQAWRVVQPGARHPHLRGRP